MKRKKEKKIHTNQPSNQKRQERKENVYLKKTPESIISVGVVMQARLDIHYFF
jgi:hypothetical protein